MEKKTNTIDKDFSWLLGRDFWTITAHREHTCSETHQCQDEKEDT